MGLVNTEVRLVKRATQQTVKLKTNAGGFAKPNSQVSRKLLGKIIY